MTVRAWHCRSSCEQSHFPLTAARGCGCRYHTHFTDGEPGPQKPAQPALGDQELEGLGVQAKCSATHTLSTSVSTQSAHLGSRLSLRVFQGSSRSGQGQC